MIKVTMEYRGAGFASLEVKGHANSGVYGHDLVCAAVSAVVVGACNAIETSEDFQIKIDSGDVNIVAPAAISVHDETVIETLIIQLKTIEESNHGFLEIKERKN
jgi:Predicted ribosomal protein